MRALLFAAVGLAGLTACFEPIDYTGGCRGDFDCDVGVCTRVNECSTEAYGLRIRWTVNGQTVDLPNACEGIFQIDVGIRDPSTGQERVVSPVPCTAGSLFYDSLPPSWSDAFVNAYDGSTLITRVTGTSVGTDGNVLLDIRF